MPAVLEATTAGPREGEGEEVGEKVGRGLDQVGTDLAEAEGVDDLGRLVSY